MIPDTQQWDVLLNHVMHNLGKMIFLNQTPYHIVSFVYDDNIKY